MKLITHLYDKEDARGKLIGLLRVGIKEINWIETKRNVVRGGHYHKKTNEYLIVISGRTKVWSVSQKGQIVWEKIIQPGDVLFVEPNDIHFLEALDDSLWINALDNEIDDSNPDIYHWKA